MRYFNVVVGEMDIVIREQAKSQGMYDFKAVINGVDCLYRIIKKEVNYQKRTIWFGRGVTAVHYHAHNIGAYVRFEPVHHATRRNSKIHEKQLSMWG